MYTLEDMVARLGLHGKQGHEIFREEVSSLTPRGNDEIRKMFPNVELSDAPTVIYAPFQLCQSLPKVNGRGRCFTPKVLANSFASVRDGVINIDHQMKYRGSERDTICGHLVCGRFDPAGLWKEDAANTKANFSTAIPLMALAAFYKKSEDIANFIAEHLSGTRKWLTSMECTYDPMGVAFLYEGELIPAAEAEAGMRECVETLRVRPYKGKPLGLALGGIDGKVAFQAAGLTPDPADGDSKIFSLVTRDEYVEMANRTGNPIFFPLERIVIQEPQITPHEEKTQAVEDMASIVILGTTLPAGADNHVHDVLSDGTIMPHADGHTHYLSSYGVVRGTNPRFTGKTETHHQYLPATTGDGYRNAMVHLHLLDISLRGKTPAEKKEGGVDPAVDATANRTTPDLASLVDIFHSHVVERTERMTKDFQARIDRILSTGKFEGEQATEVANLRKELAGNTIQQAIQDSVRESIANQIKEGTLVTKEQHDKDVKAAIDAEKAAAEKKLKEEQVFSERKSKVVGMGIDLESKFREGSELSVGDYLKQFTPDDAGNQGFEATLVMLEAVAEKNKKAKGEEEKVPDTIEAAANKGGKGKTPEAKKKLLLVGAGGGEEEEDSANNGGSKTGRFAFRGK